MYSESIAQGCRHQIKTPFYLMQLQEKYFIRFIIVSLVLELPILKAII